MRRFEDGAPTATSVYDALARFEESRSTEWFVELKWTAGSPLISLPRNVGAEPASNSDPDIPPSRTSAQVVTGAPLDSERLLAESQRSRPATAVGGLPLGGPPSIPPSAPASAPA